MQYRLLLKIALIFTLSFHINEKAKAQSSESKFQEVTNTWKGFQKIELKVAERTAQLVVPKKAIPGKPWVWRARFPTYHAEIDSMLLADGFHIAYINTDNLFGSPTAMKAWDQFYENLISSYELHEKAVLHCHSRGGLFAYNWAKKNPEKIACIYADAIVCDFKSWPGGFGTGNGHGESWEALKNAYGFKSDEEAKAFSDNPIDNLEALASAKIPILHTVRLTDQVVPPEENSLKLVNRYIRLGGTGTISPCTEGEAKSEGHHYSIDDPKGVVDFIKYHSLKNKLLDPSDFHTMRGSMKNSKIVFERTKKGRVAFVGGSITNMSGWREMIYAYLEDRFPDTEFEFIAAGISSMGTTPAAFRLERDVLSKGKIDLLFEEAAVNDATNFRTDPEQIRGMEGIVRRLKKANPAIDIVMMHFVDPDKMKDYRAGKEPKVITNHNRVAEYYSIPTINLAKEVTVRIDQGEFSWENDFKNLHPSPFGQKIYANSISRFLENAYYPQLDDDDKLSAKLIPPPLDPFSYENGKLIDQQMAKTSKGWEIDTLWNPNDGTRTRPNYVDVPMLISETPGSSLSLKFEGTAIGLAVAAGRDAGIIEYRIDKGEWKKQNLFTQWSTNVHLPWYYTLSGDLENKKHLLEVKISDQKDDRSIGHACRIRYFYVNKE
ncbi:MAG: SGNH/GDSL hydrolase family protein [Reichenbachiella sp.]